MDWGEQVMKDVDKNIAYKNMALDDIHGHRRICSCIRSFSADRKTDGRMGTYGILGTPELTQIFCINDECTYGDIPGLEFIRKTTLGTGGDKCDFYIRVSQ